MNFAREKHKVKQAVSSWYTWIGGIRSGLSQQRELSERFWNHEYLKIQKKNRIS